MKILITEDEFTSRRLLQKLLSAYGECDVASNGREAVEALQIALNEGQPYDLVCLDIMMPEMDGHEALKRIREVEAEKGIVGLDGVKVIMTTALGDSKNIFSAFRAGCEGYIIKPLDKKKLVNELKKLGLIKE